MKKNNQGHLFFSYFDCQADNVAVCGEVVFLFLPLFISSSSNKELQQMPTFVGPTLSKRAEPIQAWLIKRQELVLLFLLVMNKLLLFYSLILA